MNDLFEANATGSTSDVALTGTGEHYAASAPSRRKLVPAIISMLFILGVIWACVYVILSKSGRKDARGFPGGGFGGGAQQSVVSVRTMVAQKGVLHDYVDTNGEIQPQSSIDVFPDIGGKITRVNVSLGSTVRRGEAIAEVDPSAPGVQYRSSIVTAPISGTITRTPLKTGTTVTQNSTITVIGDVENLQVQANVPERYVSALQTGLKADITLEAYPEQTFTATVSRVSPLVDSSSRTKEIILNFDEPDERINAGMFAKVHLWTLDYDGKIVIPTAAIVEKNDKQYVYVIKDDETAVQREVSTGHTVDAQTQVLYGVNEGERVVIEGMRVLGNGAQVRDITNGSASAAQADGAKTDGAPPGTAQGATDRTDATGGGRGGRQGGSR